MPVDRRWESFARWARLPDGTTPLLKPCPSVNHLHNVSEEDAHPKLASGGEDPLCCHCHGTGFVPVPCDPLKGLEVMAEMGWRYNISGWSTTQAGVSLAKQNHRTLGTGTLQDAILDALAQLAKQEVAV